MIGGHISKSRLGDWCGTLEFLSSAQQHYKKMLRCKCIFSFYFISFFHPSSCFPAGAWCRAEWILHKTDASGDFRKDCSADYAASKSQRVLVEEVEGSHGRPLSQREQNEKPNLCLLSSWSCWIIASCLSLLNFYLSRSHSLPPFFPSNWLTDTFKACSESCAKTAYDKWRTPPPHLPHKIPKETWSKATVWICD